MLACDHPSVGDINYAMETDLNKLLVVVNLAPGIDQRIDRNHRLAKAKALGIARISAYYLSVEEHRPYIVEYNGKEYEAVVSHWKEQGK